MHTPLGTINSALNSILPKIWLTFQNRNVSLSPQRERGACGQSSIQPVRVKCHNPPRLRGLERQHNSLHFWQEGILIGEKFPPNWQNSGRFSLWWRHQRCLFCQRWTMCTSFHGTISVLEIKCFDNHIICHFLINLYCNIKSGNIVFQCLNYPVCTYEFVHSAAYKSERMFQLD